MKIRKIISRSLLVTILVALAYGIYYASIAFPIISGYGAKQMCTCVFASGMKQDYIESNELSFFPLNIGTFKVDMKDSSVTGTVWGFAKRKAIYRKDVGATLLIEMREEELKKQNFKIPPPPTINTDTIDWPAGDKLPDSFPTGINQRKLNDAMNDAFKEPFKDKQVRTRAVIVVYNGKLAAEKYAQGFSQTSLFYGWSMAKSYMNALTGILVQQNKLNLSEPAQVPEWSNVADARHNITLQNLLQQTSGIDFHEDYSGPSEVTKMLYKKDDMAAYAASLPLKHTPGTVFNYSSGNSNIISRIIRQTVGEKNYAAFPAEQLFYKTGMYHTFLEPDASGTYVGSSYVMATARDYARFGLLFYNDGVFNGTRILPEGWVQQSVTPPACNKTKNYGYQFWLNGIDTNNGGIKIYPDIPADMFYCDGHAYEEIYIIPSKKLVVVRLGLTFDNSFDENKFLKSIINAEE